MEWEQRGGEGRGEGRQAGTVLSHGSIQAIGCGLRGLILLRIILQPV